MSDFELLPSGLIVPCVAKAIPEPEIEAEAPSPKEKKPPEITRESWPDIYFSVVMEGDVDSYYVDFKVYELFTNSGEPVPADEVFLSGSVKWDGCSNFTFDEQERCMLHCCSRQQMANIGILLVRVHELAEAVMENHWNGD